ncbi:MULTISPECIES: hypothetical protein [Bradyrhizobium]|uniref:hypothetical protein n=1 Tax=Bradyrhizobium TaxID=374 RepID=UPI00041969B1|nr:MULTISPECIES: hypothetical protein [Bradyrhizobium]
MAFAIGVTHLSAAPVRGLFGNAANNASPLPAFHCDESQLQAVTSRSFAQNQLL